VTIQRGESRCSASNHEEAPGSGYSFEFVLASVLKLDVGADDEVGDGTGHEDFPRRGQRLNARSDVYPYSTDVFSAPFYFTRVQTEPKFDLKSLGGISDGTGAADRSGRPVEAVSYTHLTLPTICSV